MVWFKRILSFILFCILIYLFWPLAKELGNLGPVLRDAQWVWILAAVAIQFVSYASLAKLNTLLLRPFPGQIGFWRMISVLPCIAFIEVTVPSAGASGFVLRARLLGQSGYSLETSTFTAAMEMIFISIMMAFVSIAGLWYLVRMGDILFYQIVLLVMIALILVAAGGLAVWYARDREQVKRLALRINGIANHWLERHHRPVHSDAAISQRIDEFYDGLHQLRKRPIRLYFLNAFIRIALDIACLGACFIAFNYVISPGALLTGYGLMLLVSGLAALPGGLGFTDLSLSVIYARLGAPGAVAVAAALTYRLIAWWLVRFIGFINWQLLEVRYGKSQPSS